MAITIINIDPDQGVDLGPQTINTNFATVKAAIDEIQTHLILGAEKKLRLTTVYATLPNNSVEAATVVLTGASGTLISINPSGGATTYSVTFDGKITGVKITLSGTGADKSVMGDLDLSGAFDVTGKSTVKGELALKSANSFLTTKATVVTLTTANIGAGAATPLNLSKENFVLLNGYNGGADLATLPALPLVKIDTTVLTLGQVIKLQLLRDNSAGVQLYNGTSGNEVFAKILPSGAGFTSLADTSQPLFDAGAGNESWIEAQWLDIGGSTLRLVILATKNMTNV